MLGHFEGSQRLCRICSILGRGPVGADSVRRQCRECDQWTFITRRRIRACLQLVLKNDTVESSGLSRFLQCTVSVDSSFTIRLGRPFFLFITRRGFVIPRPTPSHHRNKTSVTTQPGRSGRSRVVLTQQLFVGCQRREQQRKSTSRENSGSHLHHAPSRRRSCFATREAISGRSIATTTTLTLLTSHCHLYAFFLFFTLDVPLPKRFWDECALHHNLPCVLSRKPQ